MSIVLYKLKGAAMSQLEREMMEKGVPFRVIEDLPELELYPALEINGEILDYKEAKEWVENWQV